MTKVYRLYDVGLEKAFFSRVVVFDETRNGFERLVWRPKVLPNNMFKTMMKSFLLLCDLNHRAALALAV